MGVVVVYVYVGVGGAEVPRWEDCPHQVGRERFLVFPCIPQRVPVVPGEHKEL